jgi:hypothetical protein
MPKTKTVFLGTTKILQWNAGDLSPQKFTEMAENCDQNLSVCGKMYNGEMSVLSVEVPM